MAQWLLIILQTLLAELCAVPAPSGAEASSPAAAAAGPRCEVRRDPVGNVVAHVGGSGPRVLVQAHMDQVGYVVRFVTEDGFCCSTAPRATAGRSGAPSPGRPAGPVLTPRRRLARGLIVAASGHVLTAAQREKDELGYDDFWVELGLGDRARCSTPACTSARPSCSPRPTRALGDLLVGPAWTTASGWR